MLLVTRKPKLLWPGANCLAIHQLARLEWLYDYLCRRQQIEEIKLFRDVVEELTRPPLDPLEPRRAAVLAATAD